MFLGKIARKEKRKWNFFLGVRSLIVSLINRACLRSFFLGVGASGSQVRDGVVDISVGSGLNQHLSQRRGEYLVPICFRFCLSFISDYNYSLDMWSLGYMFAGMVSVNLDCLIIVDT